MTATATDSVERKGTDMTALRAREQTLLDTNHSENRVGLAAGALDPRASARVAAKPAVMPFGQRLDLLLKVAKPRLVLKKLRFQRFVLMLKLRIAGFLLSALGFDQRDLLAKQRRRSMLVDQALNRREQLIKNFHGQSFSNDE